MFGREFEFSIIFPSISSVSVASPHLIVNEYFFFLFCIKGINLVAKKLKISADTGKGYRALVNISENGGQEVPHLHFHLFGGEKIGKMVE